MSLQHAAALRQRLSLLQRMRPMVVRTFLTDLMAPSRRTIIDIPSRGRFFVDPLSQFGCALMDENCYEYETEDILRQFLSPGASFLDVGANEGYFTVFAGKLVGPTGYIASVEPQSRLLDVLEINVALNDVRTHVFHGALGGAPNEQSTLYLAPVLNTGYSSLAKRPRFTRESETIRFLDPLSTLGDREHFDLAKVDVEGFEDKVTESLLPMLRQGKIRTLLLDFHINILAAKGADPRAIEASILASGMQLAPGAEGYSGYRLYTYAASSMA